MLAQIEEKNKYEPIKTKESILFIVEAWKKVSKETIKNCWRHSGKVNQLITETEEAHINIENKKTIEEIKELLSKFKAGYAPVYTKGDVTST
jgi:uncharacterized protein YbbC (DUF1343 family)